MSFWKRYLTILQYVTALSLAVGGSLFGGLAVGFLTNVVFGIAVFILIMALGITWLVNIS